MNDKRAVIGWASIGITATAIAGVVLWYHPQEWPFFVVPLVVVAGAAMLRRGVA